MPNGDEIKEFIESYKDNPDDFIEKIEKFYAKIKPDEDNKNYDAEWSFLLGQSLVKENYLKLAIACFKKSLIHCIDKDTEIFKKQCNHNIGFILMKLNKFEESLEYFKKSIDINNDLGDKEIVMNSAHNLGYCFEKLTNYIDAIENYQIAYQIAKGNPKHQEALELIQQSIARCANIPIQFFSYALHLATKIGDIKTQADCYYEIGRIYKKLSRESEAKAMANKMAQTLFMKPKNIEDDVIINYFNEILDIAKEMGFREGKSWAYGNLGEAYGRLNEHNTAIDYFTKALDFSNKNDEQTKIKQLKNIGISNYNLGKFSKTIKFTTEALELAVKTKNEREQCHCYTLLGNVNRILGNVPIAIDFHNQALSMAKKIPDISKQIWAYGNIGNCYRQIKNYNDALKNLEEASKLFEENVGGLDQALFYANLAITYGEMGDHENAFTYSNKAISIVKDKDKNIESACYLPLASYYLEKENYDEAEKFYKHSLELSKETSYVTVQSFSHYGLATVYLASNNHNLAYEHLRKSIELEEHVLETIEQKENQINFFGTKTDVFDLMINLCYSMTKYSEAFSYLEKSKSRSFLRSLSKSAISPRIAISKDFQALLDEENTLLSRLKEIQELKHSFQEYSEIYDFEKINQQLRTVYQKMEKFDPEYVFLRSGKPTNVETLQKILLGKNAVLVEFYLSDEQSLIFIVSPDNFSVEPMSLSKEELEDIVQKYRNEVVNFRGKDIGESWLDLGEHIIEPIKNYLSDYKLIYFIPYNYLHYLPLHALKLHGKRIIQEHPVVYSPSSSVLQFFERKGSKLLQSCASFGVEFLDEAKDVAAIFNTTPHLNATKDKVLKNIQNDILHFSCHGYFDEIDPLASGLILEDEDLTAREIFDLKLNSSLVTLSACDTGINKRHPGDELTGLTNSFLHAGSSSVLVSLWEVNSYATEEIMKKFYKNVSNGKMAEALQYAQIELMKKPEFDHPYFWAPFILVGDSENN